jgi:hypothetical protein
MMFYTWIIIDNFYEDYRGSFNQHHSCQLNPPFFQNHFLETLSKGCYFIKASNGQELFSEILVVE